MFTDAELTYLHAERRLGRLATVGPDGMPHVAPVGWSLEASGEVVRISGRDFAATKKFRDVARTGRAAIVIDDVLPPWHPRGSRSGDVPRPSRSPSPTSGYIPYAW